MPKTRPKAVAQNSANSRLSRPPHPFRPESATVLGASGETEPLYLFRPSAIHRSDSFESRPHSRFAPGSSVVHLASMGAVWADVQCERALFACRSPRLTPLLRWRHPLGVPLSLRACNARDAQSQPEQPESASRYQRPSCFWALRIWRRICRPAGQETLLPPPSTPGPAITSPCAHLYVIGIDLLNAGDALAHARALYSCTLASEERRRKS